MGWAAIDFEIANSDRASACALGLVLVQDSQIVKRRSWLIRPSKLSFDLNNVVLHGITADHVAEMPTFAEHLAGSLDGIAQLWLGACFALSRRTVYAPQRRGGRNGLRCDRASRL